VLGDKNSKKKRGKKLGKKEGKKSYFYILTVYSKYPGTCRIRESEDQRRKEIIY
jgi:hypothetical protein